ncbi:Unknown protein [Striga hermonthica]|uniref:Uncharacterized protein n=1 Tax=Striga hermonthica TaxID=68872 RepID=A0A9N7NAE6_STRHE|nr:Unknown protein [Striga hermonthica]
MRRYPSVASFLEGLRPFRPWKFEAITGEPAEESLSVPEKIDPRTCSNTGGPLHGATPRRVLLPRGHRPLWDNEPRRGMRQGKLIGASAFVAPFAVSEGVNPVNHRVFERKLRPKPHGRGHACLGVTHHVALRPPLYGAIGWGGHWPPVCIKLAASLNEFTRRPPSRQALVEHSTLLLSCWTERRIPIETQMV